MASISYVILDAKARQVDLLFDSSVTANVAVNFNSAVKNNASGGSDSSSLVNAAPSSPVVNSDGIGPIPLTYVVSQSQNYNYSGS